MLDPKADKILFAATELFLEVGYAAASMDAVAKRAQVSKTTLYSRFPSKEQLFSACVRAVCDQHYGFTPEMFDHIEVADALEQLGDSFLALIWSPAALRGEQVIVGEAARLPELARLYFDSGPAQTIALVVRFFERTTAQGRLRVDDPQFAARQFFAVLRGHIDCELRLGLCQPPEPEARRGHVRKVVRMFLDGVGGR